MESVPGVDVGGGLRAGAFVVPVETAVARAVVGVAVCPGDEQAARTVQAVAMTSRWMVSEVLNVRGEIGQSCHVSPQLLRLMPSVSAGLDGDVALASHPNAARSQLRACRLRAPLAASWQADIPTRTAC